MKIGKVDIHATMSLDGYIAGPNDDLSWMSAYVGPNKVADEMIRMVGASMAQLGLKTSLADEIQLHLAPILLGEGVQLFGQSGAGYFRLERMQVVASPKVTDLRFRIMK